MSDSLSGGRGVWSSLGNVNPCYRRDRAPNKCQTSERSSFTGVIWDPVEDTARWLQRRSAVRKRRSACTRTCRISARWQLVGGSSWSGHRGRERVGSEGGQSVTTGASNLAAPPPSGRGRAQNDRRFKWTDRVSAAQTWRNTGYSDRDTLQAPNPPSAASSLPSLGSSRPFLTPNLARRPSIAPYCAPLYPAHMSATSLRPC